MDSRQQEAGVAFCRSNDVQLCVLFGSAVSGRTHPGSDVDLAFQIKKEASLSKLDIIFELEPVFHPRMLDPVIVTPKTDLLLLHEIFLKGYLLYEAFPELFLKAQLRAWHLSLDTAPLREFERQWHVKAMPERLKGVS